MRDSPLALGICRWGTDESLRMAGASARTGYKFIDSAAGPRGLRIQPLVSHDCWPARNGAYESKRLQVRSSGIG